VLTAATLDDAQQAGLDECATLVSTGADTMGTILALTSDAFQRLFAEAKVIIAKGQANYETLSPGDDRVFFLLKAKCPVIAGNLDAETGGLIVKQGHAPAS
jgi:damage-control phosphatase, subfamily I